MKFTLLALTLFLAVTNALSASNLFKHKEKSKSNVIKLTKNNYERILEGPRDSYILLLLTATNPQVGCTICQQLSPEFDKLADSWFSDHPDGDNLFFARSDFADGYREIFQAFQLNNVPRLYLYSPTEDTTKFNENLQQLPVPGNNLGQELAAVLSELTEKDVKIYEAVPYGSILITAIFTFCSVLLLKKNFSSVSTVFSNKPLWGGLTVFSILVFITGYMFNAIRGMPYARTLPDGRAEYFVSGQQAQLGAETQIMSFIYAILAFSFVSLVTRVKYIKNEKVQFIAVAIIVFIILVVYSALFLIFKFKSPGYPYQLLKLWG
ncbi:Magnesium transporter protein 1 [Wickerhamomyces ciferrii]|uniref:Magnesium transporter protein 1 n=1 Tax=Wickerhamomyces ciferrii (strain ATCC 14091 / BCRC 22168 / CBS 111 / JCM 3599 / NBRC 0793 / NRRL Y-1031 F-60-10) TaxID=1206466 RepID=K0KGR4_WICCF|nr:Magnesium transporter protein 1 [Wickerhamomyces ciferrii]CCH40604.1 Magnesium transporter protein 1 [Wickerhamomyces ciferrii]